MIYPIYTQMLSREEREKKLRQRAKVIWLFGLSGSGKSTLVTALEHRLFTDGFTTTHLDGDNRLDQGRSHIDTVADRTSLDRRSHPQGL